MLTIKQTERRLAVVANWGLFGSFGLGLIQSGLSEGSVAIGLLGFGLIVIGFVAQVIINHLYGGGFSRGEIALGISAFGIAVLGFIAGWLFDPGFGSTDAIVGLAGFFALVASFLIYLVARYGLKGSFSMFHEMGHH